MLTRRMFLTGSAALGLAACARRETVLEAPEPVIPPLPDFYGPITDEPYPRMFWTRDVKRDGSRYLGPYSNARHMRTMLDVMHKVFPVRSCRYHLPDSKVKLCMEYQIRRCEGPCEDLVSQEQYRRTVDHAIRFLRGNKSGVIRELTTRMQEAAARQNFEQAANNRDQIQALKHYQ